MKKKWSICIYIISISLLLSGCWSHRELTDIGFVVGIGIDKGRHQRFKLSYQIINPKNVTGSQQQSGLTGPATTIYQSEGDNILEANRAATKQVSRQLYFAHTSLVVVSEEITKDGIRDILDALTRSQEFRPNAEIVIAKDSSAEELLNVLTPIDQINANKINKTLKFTQQMWGENIESKVFDVASSVISKGKQPLISGFKIEGEKDKSGSEENITSQKALSRIHADSIAVFKDDKQVAWADGSIARGINWGLGKIKSTIINVNWNNKPDAIGITVLRSQSKIISDVKNNKPQITVHIKLEGNIGESTTKINLTDQEEIIKVQNELSKKVKREVENAIKYGQKYKADIFEFGENLSKSNPRYWKKVDNKWTDEVFPTLDVDVKVDAFIRLTGLKTKSLLYE